MDKSLARLTKKKRKVTNGQNQEQEKTSLPINQVKGIVRKYFELFSANIGQFS